MNRRKDVAGNRAVSALFRVFGGQGRREYADGFERTDFGAMHNGERLVLGVLVPATVLVGLSEWLVRWWGGVAGWLLVLPLSFVLLNLLAFFLPGKKPTTKWRVWLATLTAWGWWRMDAEGYVSWFAWLWLAIFALNVLAAGLLGVGWLMRMEGGSGIAIRAGLFIGLHVAAVLAGWWWGWGWAVAIGAVIAAIYCRVVLHPGCQALGPVLRFRDGRRILITIDDGPDPKETPELLDRLDQHGAKALFFMIGDKVRQHPELAREVVRRGHEIGNHTMTHPQGTFWCAGPARTRREIEECTKAILEVTGESPKWFRAPVGHRNLFTHPVAESMGMKVMGWSRRGFDAITGNPRSVLERILPVTGGDIVLMHEGTGFAAEVLDGVLDAAGPAARADLDGNRA